MCVVNIANVNVNTAKSLDVIHVLNIVTIICTVKFRNPNNSNITNNPNAQNHNHFVRAMVFLVYNLQFAITNYFIETMFNLSTWQVARAECLLHRVHTLHLRLIEPQHLSTICHSLPTLVSKTIGRVQPMLNMTI